MNKVTRLFLSIVLFVGFIFLNPSKSVRAAVIFNVNSVADAQDINPGDGICKASPIKNVCTLRAAIMEANALAGTDTIRLQALTYTLTIDGNRSVDNDDNAFTGDLDITDSVTIQHLSVTSTGRATIQGGTGWTERIFEGVSGTINFSRLNVQGGNAFQPGGGILDSGSTTMNLTNVTVQGNSSTGDGGGLNLSRTATMVNVTVRDNISSGNGGGIFSSANTTITNSLITNNISNGPSGGGGLFAIENTSISNTSINNNLATSTTLGGGGIFLTNDAQFSIVNSTISENTAQNGGGILIKSTGFSTPLIQSSTIHTNTALSDGGGIFLAPSSGSDRTVASLGLINSTISGNIANNNGGGAFISDQTDDDDGEDPPAGLLLANVTIAFNTADSDGNNTGNGGGIMAVSLDIFVKNTLLASNIDASPNVLDQHPDCSGVIGSGGYNLFQSTIGCTVEGDTTGNILNQNPALSPLQNWGGPTFTHLPSYSIGLDDGNPTGCTDFQGNLLTIDQRGEPRHQGEAGIVGICDIGSVELEQPT